MWSVKACAVCFSTDVKLFSLNEGERRQHFNIISGLRTHPRNGIPGYLCVECFAYVRKFIKFRDKCHRAQYAWEFMLTKNKEINNIDLKCLNLEELQLTPTLAFANLNKFYYKCEEFQWTKDCRQNVTPDKFIPIAHYSTLTTEYTFQSAPERVESETEIKREIYSTIIKDDDDNKPVNLTDRYMSIGDSALNNTESCLSDQNNEDTHFNDDDYEEVKPLSSFKTDVNGEKFNEDYATIVPISVKEAKAVVEIKKRSKDLKWKCGCGWSTTRQENLEIHSRRHDKYTSGHFHCEICDYYYKTNYLLQTHMSDKHMYKYLCKKCNDVNFDRSSAKQHYNIHHNNKIEKKNCIPTKKINKKKKEIKDSEYVNGVKRVPKDYLTFETIKPEEQYAMVEMRKTTKNYLQANFKCELCFKGFRCTSTFNKHMAKHDPEISGKYQCDICKLYFENTRKMYKHLNTNHITKYSCKLCEYFTANRSQALMHIRWHQNITYDCPLCERKFVKISTQLTHLRLKHPSMFICKICGHSFVSSQGLHCHNQQTHSKEDIDAAENQKPNPKDPNYCEDCDIQFFNSDAYTTHLGSSSKHVQLNKAFIKDRFKTREEVKKIRRKVTGRPGRQPNDDIINNGLSIAHNCDICGVLLTSDIEANKHYKTEHPGVDTDYLKRYMCDVCGHTTKQYANLVAHMRRHTQEKPYACPHCDRRFSMPSNRDRHIVVHTGEKRYECQHCGRRFTQSSAKKLHIQTVHMKIPYAPWDKKRRKRKKEMEPTTADLNMVAPQTTTCIVQQTDHKIIIENPSEYIGAYITYTDE